MDTTREHGKRYCSECSEELRVLKYDDEGEPLVWQDDEDCCPKTEKKKDWFDNL